VIFTETPVKGAFLMDLEPREDERGFFARTWCEREGGGRGMNLHVAQCNVSFNKKLGTLRGLHYQAAPFEEAKLVRCTHGSIYDVIVDLRPASPSFKRHLAAVLSAGNRRAVYVPEGCAHGFQTLEDDTEVFYQMSAPYSADHARGVRWNDPAFGIEWPAAERIMADRDRTYPDFAL
jgi:dTDP-4-dehydrorhamnose 3,5-epimerase